MKKLVLFFFVFSTIMIAQTGQRSVREILDKSGRIVPNFNGSYNARGYSLSYGKNNEPILTIPEGTESATWSPIIYNGINGINNPTSSVMISGNDVYVGGYFTAAGGVPANCIAKWNTSTHTWSALGPGLNGTVFSIGIYGSNVYAGGTFNATGGGELGVNNIAKWDGSSWTALGSGLQGGMSCVYSIAIDGSGNVFAGGSFTTAGGISANNIAKWNGSAWSALGSGLGVGGYDYLNALQFVGTDLYAGGGFEYETAFSCIAKWNGSTWSALGSGADNDVGAIGVIGNDLYVGGFFTTAGGVSANHFAKYNTLSNTWSPLGTGVGDVYIYSISTVGNAVYVGGKFPKAGGVTVNNITKWDGTNWSSLGGVGASSPDFVYQTAYSTNAGCMFVTGSFTQVNGSITANNIASFTDNSTPVLSLTAYIQGLYNESIMVSDTVTVELRNSGSPHGLVESKKGVLNTSGVGSFTFANAVNGTPYYIVVKHRNAIETWSATTQTFVSNALGYDFTSDQSKAYGGNLILKGTKWCIYSGDITKEGAIDIYDLSQVDNDVSNFASGYIVTDVNGDQSVDIFDLSIVDNNSSSFVCIIVPPGAHM